jgi:hypothetical protein
MWIWGRCLYEGSGDGMAVRLKRGLACVLFNVRNFHFCLWLSRALALAFHTDIVNCELSVEL